MDKKREQIFEEFGQLLNERFRALDERETSEDDIRYMFYLACTGEKGGINRSDIMLEKKGVIEGSEKAELDTFIRKNDKTPCLAVEFKYHRQELNTPLHFDWAGNLVCDFHRLTRLKDEAAGAERLSVYVANNDMIVNYENRRARGDWAKPMCDLILTPPFANAQPFALPNASATFMEKTKVAGAAFTGCTIQCLFAKDLAGGNVLRIFEIK